MSDLLKQSQDLASMAQALCQKVKQEVLPASFLNEIMVAVKSIEASVKDLRSTCTETVDKRQLVLADFTLSVSNERALVKAKELHEHLVQLGLSPDDQFKRKILSVGITAAETALKELKAADIPESIKPELWVKNYTAPFMAKETTRKVALKSAVKSNPN